MLPSRVQKPSPKASQARRPPRRRRNNVNRGQEVSVPVATTRLARTQAPKIEQSLSPTGDGRVRIRHREYIQDVSGSVGFSCTQLPINPGMSATFPWLSTIARNYESYLFKKCEFQFETQKSSATNGSLMMAVDFDAADTAPTSKTEIMAFHNAVRSAVWSECANTSDKQDLAKFGAQRYNRSAALASNLDIKTYDVGNLNVATQGCADTSAIGELYVDYDVEFMTPQVASGSTGSNGQLLVGVSGTASTAWLGTTPTSTGQNYFSATGNTFTCLVPGTYLFVNYFASSASTGANSTGTATIDNSVASSFGSAGNGTSSLTTVRGVTATLGQTVILNDTGSSWSAFSSIITPIASAIVSA